MVCLGDLRRVFVNSYSNVQDMVRGLFVSRVGMVRGWFVSRVGMVCIYKNSQNFSKLL